MSNEEKRKYSDIFYRKNLLYPDAASIFSFRPKLVEEIKDDCFIVLDTNVLLIPYTTGKHSLEQIKDIYSKLTLSKRLIIPGQVAREFADNRVNKLKDLYQQISRKKTSSLSLGAYPLLSGLDAFKKASEAQQEVNTAISKFNTAVDEILETIMNWYWNDPVSKLYGDLFVADLVIDPKCDEKRLLDKLEINTEYKLPPAYKDSSKEDSGIGDLLIWDTILGVGKEHKKSVIFVSADQKTDWLSQSENRALYPRYELVNEYCLASEGQSFHIVKFSDFLKLFGATEEVVEEVRKEEVIAQVSELATPRVSSRIVRSWLDTVINPMLQHLHQEEVLLGNITWSWEVPPGRLTRILPIKRVVTTDNFEQFLSFYPQTKFAIDEHDSECGELYTHCKNLHWLIMGNLQFQEIYRRAKADSSSTTDHGDPVNRVFSNFNEEDHLSQLAQYVVNKTARLPIHNGYHLVWNKYRDEMLQVLEGEPLCYQYAALKNSGGNLLSTIYYLSDLLKETRNHLSLSYGEPIIG